MLIMSRRGGVALVAWDFLGLGGAASAMPLTGSSAATERALAFQACVTKKNSVRPDPATSDPGPARSPGLSGPAGPQGSQGKPEDSGSSGSVIDGGTP